MLEKHEFVGLGVEYYCLNVNVSLKFTHWHSTPQCVSIRRWGFGEVIRL